MNRSEWAIRERGPEETGCFAFDIDAVHIPSGRHVTFRLTLRAVHTPEHDGRSWEDRVWAEVAARAGQEAA